MPYICNRNLKIINSMNSAKSSVGIQPTTNLKQFHILWMLDKFDESGRQLCTGKTYRSISFWGALNLFNFDHPDVEPVSVYEVPATPILTKHLND